MASGRSGRSGRAATVGVAEHANSVVLVTIGPRGELLDRYNDTPVLGDLFNAIVYYGNVRDVKVPARNP